MAGKLYLCATPIGNLEDMTFRVVRTLKEVDLIGAEDTRNSIKLLNHFDIDTPMQSYHEFNKYDKAKELVQMMKDGKTQKQIPTTALRQYFQPHRQLQSVKLRLECLQQAKLLVIVFFLLLNRILLRFSAYLFYLYRC